MQFSKGDRVRVKRSTAWSEAGATGTVVQLDKSMARVTFDGAYPGTWWAMPSEIEKVEKVEGARPTGPTWFSKGDRVRIKMGPHSGSLGTVRDFIGGDVWVTVDDDGNEGWLHKVTEIEGVEEAKPTDSTQFRKGDRVRTKVRHFSGTVQGFLGSKVLVAFDGSPEQVRECLVDKIEKIEESRPTDSIQVDNIVNHPPHYTGFSNGAEVIDITECLAYNRGNAIKYLARAGKKNPDRELEDLKKALWFVAREIERLEKSEKKEEK